MIERRQLFGQLNAGWFRFYLVAFAREAFAREATG